MIKEYKKVISGIIVEDEIVSALYLKSILEKENFKVLNIVSDGRDAIKKIEEQKPDVIIMDILLSGKINGIKVAKAVRKFTDSPIIFITGYSSSDIIMEIGYIKNSSYLEKPLDANKIVSLIYEIIDKRK